MNTQLPTYEQQFNKITEAYIKDEIEPYDSEFCFCGTLNPYRNIEGLSMAWNYDLNGVTQQYRHPQPYTYKEYKRMEIALFDNLREVVKGNAGWEERLFSGMCEALEVLKQIHIERGEVIDDTPVFKKRELLTPVNV